MPVIAVFHIGILLYFLYDMIVDPIGILVEGQVIVMVLYSFFWLFVCDLKKWAALSYMGLTTANLVVKMVASESVTRSLSMFLDTLFPADVLFTMIIMLYFKKLE